jgi:hypothetical protein
VLVVFQLWSARVRTPLGLGNSIILEYIKVALGFALVNVIGVVGGVLKRKC